MTLVAFGLLPLLRQGITEKVKHRHSPLQAKTEAIMHQHVMASGSATQ